jgi:hypothetical protein
MADTPQVVFVTGHSSGGGPRTVHLFRDCPNLATAKTLTEKDRRVLFDSAEVCGTCQGMAPDDRRDRAGTPRGDDA